MGTAMAMVVAVNSVLTGAPRPTENMWWAHTLPPMNPMARVAATIMG
jgi:hypothetical protein